MMTERKELDCAQVAPRDQTYVLEDLLYSIACVSVHGCWATDAFRRAEKHTSAFFFFFPHLCPQVDEWSMLVQVKLPPSTNSLRRSLHRRPDNGTVLQRSCLLCPILLWPPPAFVRIHHDISTDPNHYHLPSPSPSSLYGERLHLDHNEKFICTQQLMATLISYRNISSRIFPPSCFHPQNLFKPLLLFASSTTPSWVVLNPSGPLGFLLCLK